MSSIKLSTQDKRDLEKFTRFLALKATQIIIQSRSGEKINTKCKPNSSGTDWFNLAIQDVPEILTETKKVLCEEIVGSSIPLCVEISLRTAEGDNMVLEMWSLGILSEDSDPTVRITYTVYNRMGTLLKSLLSVSRVTPAYKLSRRQGPDSYVICFRIFMGEPQLHNLGDNYKQVRVGQLCTPVGLIHLSVSYRTKMMISPTKTGRESIMLKSDHFHSDLSPRHTRYHQNEDVDKSLNSTVKVGAFVANKEIVFNEEDNPSDIPFGSLLTRRQISSSPLVSANETINTTTISSATIDINNGNGRLLSDNATPICNSQNESRRNSSSVTSANDFIMVDLKTPFAVTNTSSDLGTFYRECQTAPPLMGFTEDQTLAEQIGDLTEQLEVFETTAHLYDDLLKSLYKSDNNN